MTAPEEPTQDEHDTFAWRCKARVILFLMQMGLVALLLTNISADLGSVGQRVNRRPPSRHYPVADDFLGLPNESLRPILWGAVVLNTIALLAVWRCPRCGRGLGRSLGAPRFCANCGVALRR